MLKHLQKFFAASAAQPAEADLQKEAMTDETKLEADKSGDPALALALSQLAETQAALVEAQAALNAITEAKATAEADAAATKLAARKAAVILAIGTDQADAFLAATESMPDTQFNTVMAAMSTKAKLEASSQEFKEVGVDAQANVESLVKEAETSGTGAILMAKYQKQASK